MSDLVQRIEALINQASAQRAVKAAEEVIRSNAGAADIDEIVWSNGCVVKIQLRDGLTIARSPMRRPIVQLPAYLLEVDARYLADVARLAEVVFNVRVNLESDGVFVSWASIYEHYEYVTKDRDGEWWAYCERPEVNSLGTSWDSGGAAVRLDSRLILDPHDVDWRESLMQRAGTGWEEEKEEEEEEEEEMD